MSLTGLSGLSGLSGVMGGVAQITYLLRDQFTTNRAAGSVNGTAAEPGPGTRAVTDGSNLLPVTGSALTPAAGGSATNPRIAYGSIARAAGRLMGIKVNVGDGGGCYLGWASNSGGNTSAHSFYLQTSQNMYSYYGFALLGSLVYGAPYWYAVVLRASGAYMFVYGATFTTWTLYHIDRAQTTTPLYPAWNYYNSNANMVIDDVVVPDVLWSPTPLASDSFNRANGAPGDTDAAEGGPALAWSDRAGTAAIATNKLGWSALSGGVGLATVTTSGADVVAIANLTRSAGNIGIVVRYVDTSNYIIAYHNGTQARLDKVVAGVTTNVISGNATYSAGADLEVIAQGSAFRIAYNNTHVGSEATIADTALRSGTIHGLYTTDTGNTADNLLIQARAGHTALNSYAMLQQAMPLVVTDGDSLTAGAGVTVANAWPFQYSVAVGRTAVDVYNVAVYGQTAADIESDAATQVDPLVNGPYPKKIVTCWAGTNDISAGADAATVYSRIQTYCANRRAAGWRVVVGTIIARGTFGAGAEAVRVAVNASIVAGYASFADALCDLAADSRLSDPNNTTYFQGDKTHLTASGAGVVAALMQPVIAGL